MTRSPEDPAGKRADDLMTVLPRRVLVPPALSATPEITIGITTDAAWVAVSGRGTWVHAATFHHACREALASGRRLISWLL